MKKRKKVLSLLLCAVMTVGLAACGNGGGGGNGGNGGGSPANAGGSDAAKQYVYKTEDLNIEGLTENTGINNVVFMNGKIYLLTSEYRYDDMTGVEISLIESEADGSHSEKTQLFSNVRPNVYYGDGEIDEGMDEEGGISDLMPRAYDLKTGEGTEETGSEEVTAASDEEGEETEEPVEDVTGDNGSFDDSWVNGTVLNESGVYLLLENSRNDVDGYYSQLVLYSYALDGTKNYEKVLCESTGDDYMYLNNLCASNDGVFAAISDSELVIFDQEGNQTGSASVDTSGGWVNSLFFDKDNNLDMLMVNSDYTKMTVRQYDKNGKQLGADREISSKLLNYGMRPGVKYDIFVTDQLGAYGYNFGDEDVTQIFSYINSDINSNNVNSVYEMDEDRLLMTYYMDDTGENKVALLTHVDPKDVPDKQTITLGCYYLDWDLRSRIVDFNKNNDTYRITVTDYSRYIDGSDYQAGYTQLNNDILSGKMPDILTLYDTNTIPVDSYISKGLLADIGEMIKNDPDLNYDDYLSNVFEAYMHDGKLYTLVPKFIVQTVMGKTSIVGEKEGWTMDDLKALMEKYPDVSVFGDTITRSDLLWMLMSYSGSQFVDRETGKCSFNSPEFVSLLEFMKQFPEEFDYDSLPDDYWQNSQLAYKDNKVLLMTTSIADMESYINQRGMFGEPVTLIGFPCKEGNGAVISPQNVYLISAKSKVQEGAWQFLRYYLTDEYQKNDSNSYTLPVKKDALREKINQGTERPFWIDQDGNKTYYDYTAYFGDEEVILDPLTQEEADALYDYITSVNKASYNDDALQNIITEETAAYFADQKSAEDVADIIQSRAQLYINESR